MSDRRRTVRGSAPGQLAGTLLILGVGETAFAPRSPRSGPSRGLDDLGPTALEWVNRFNHRRLFHGLGRIAPSSLGAAHHPGNGPAERAKTQTA